MFLVALATAAPIEVGERLEWSIEWMGMKAGVAWAQLLPDGEGYRIEAGCDTAGIAERMYPVHDRLTSRWSPEEGSRSYSTRFREGRFQQDQFMEFLTDAFVVRRSQLTDEGWRTREERYAPTEGVEDPVSAFYRIRAAELSPGESTRFPLFTGRRTLTLTATAGRPSLVGKTPALGVEVGTDNGSEVSRRFTVYFSQDEDRLPVQVVVQTRAGPVSATLARRQMPGR